MNSHNFSSLFTPDYSHLTGLVKHLNVEELKAILNNDEKAKELINDLRQVKDIESEREMLLAGNKSLSEYNLSKKSLLEETQENLESTYRKAVELKDKLLAAKNDLEGKSHAQSKETLLALLQAASSEIEEEAEATVDAFLRKDLSVEDFLEKYLELRKLAHLRRIKSEKLISIIQSSGDKITTPDKPNRLRKPPPPPVPNPSVSVYPNFTPYPNPVHQNIPVVPTRQAPQPPIPSNQNPLYLNSNYPAPYINAVNTNYSPFSYLSPSPYPPQSSNFPANKK